MTPPAIDHTSRPQDHQRRLQEWCRLWRVEDLDRQIKVEISSRMTRSLGRCYSDRKLIRIAQFVVEESDELFQEVLCHEAAHVAAYHLHGRSIRPHGREWKALVQMAGYLPTVRFKGSFRSRAPARTPSKSFLETLFEGLQGALSKKTRAPAFRQRRPDAWSRQETPIADREIVSDSGNRSPQDSYDGSSSD